MELSTLLKMQISSKTGWLSEKREKSGFAFLPFSCIGNKNKPPAMQVCSQKALASRKNLYVMMSLRFANQIQYNKEVSEWITTVYHTQNGHANLKYKYGNRHFWCRGYYVDTVGKNAKKIEEYVKNQMQEDLEYDQMSLKEYIDPFTGEPVNNA